jgi:hypothetical protein
MKRGSSFSRLKSSLSIFILLLALQAHVVFGQKCKTTGIKRTDINGSTWLLNNVYNGNQELVTVTVNQVSYPMAPFSYLDNAGCSATIHSLEFDPITFYKYKKFVAKNDYLQHGGLDQSPECTTGHPRDTYNDQMYSNSLDGTGRVVRSNDSTQVGYVYYLGSSLKTTTIHRQFEYLDSNLRTITYNKGSYLIVFAGEFENGVSTYEYDTTINYNNMTQFNISDTRLLYENNKNHIKSITTIGHVNSYGDTSLKKVNKTYSYLVDSMGCISSVNEKITTEITKNGTMTSSDSLVKYTYYYSENPLSIANPFYANQNRLCAQLLIQRANDVISVEKLPSQSALEVFNISGALLSRFEGQEKVFLPSQNSPLILHLTSSGQSCSKIVAPPF